MTLNSSSPVFSRRPESKPLGLFQRLSLAMVVTVTAAVVTTDFSASFREQRVNAAWEVVRVTQGDLGDLGRKAALETLNSEGEDLSALILWGAHLKEVRLPHARLRSAQLQGATLAWADLSQADLSMANLAHANLEFADMTGALLSGADLTEANLSQATGLTAEGLSNALIHNTILPEYIRLDSAGVCLDEYP